MLICYDKMWPETCRELTLRGADILVMSTAWPMMSGHGDGDDNTWLLLAVRICLTVSGHSIARWFISSNFIGELGGIEFFGMSQIVDPFGEVVVTTRTEMVGLVHATVDIQGRIGDARASTQGPFLIRDRRPMRLGPPGSFEWQAPRVRRDQLVDRVGSP